MANQQANQGPANGPKPPQAASSDEVEITYVPGDGDPAKTKWRGIEFRANVAVKVKDKDLIEAARSNPFYRVGDAPQAKNPNAAPKTNMEYRAHVVEWLKNVESVDELVDRWSAAPERSLRQQCEVGSDDISYLGTLIEPKLGQLARSEGLSDAQVSAIWAKHGVAEVPWRS